MGAESEFECELKDALDSTSTVGDIMTKGYSLHFGLNGVDPAHYAGWAGLLRGCENDARSMFAIAKSKGFEAKTFLTAEATSVEIFNQLRLLSAKAQSNDIVLLTFSGHGGQITDTTGEEDDGYDETLCFYDRAVIDDELNLAFMKFGKGVRILVVSDSCHSATVSRVDPPQSVSSSEHTDVFRLLPTDIAELTFRQNLQLYAAVQQITAGLRDEIAPSVLLMGACQDNQLSADGLTNGRFTEHLLTVWSNGQWSGGGYENFVAQIRQRMPRTQSPSLFPTGQANPSFLNQDPFTI